MNQTRKFTHPTVQHGFINHGDDSFEIKAGVVELPEDLGRELGLLPFALAGKPGTSKPDTTGAGDQGKKDEGGKKDDEKKDDAGKPDGPGAVIVTLNADKAKVLIAETKDVELLKAFAAAETGRADGKDPRVSVTRAIDEQLAAIAAAADTTGAGDQGKKD